MFYLKKLISSILEPLSIFLILFLVALFYLLKNRTKKAKLFFIISFIWLFIISNSFVANKLLVPLEYKYKMLKRVPKNIKYILVLGHGHQDNQNIPINSQISKIGLVRVNEGIRLYLLSKKRAKLIFSGYSGLDNKRFSHATIQKKLALSLGVDKKDIILQTKPKDTKEEALNAKKIVKKSKFILVTSASHMPRAIEIFNSVGLKPIPAPTDFHSQKKIKKVSFFSAYNIENTQIAFHEYLGILWHRIVLAYNTLLGRKNG